MSFYYLATPYTRFPGGIEAAFIAACEQTALLVRHRIPIYSPIAATHPVAIHGGLDPMDHTIWLPHDKPMMRAASGLIVCMLPTWKDSYGIAFEQDEFDRMGKPILFMEPGIVPASLLG